MAYPPFDGIFYKEIDDQSLNLGVHFDFYTQSLTSLKWGYKLI